MFNRTNSISLLNLNLMHGRNRRSALWPPTIGRREAQGNLIQIAQCISGHSPDIVTLQEVDEGSWLSGNFNHFEFLKDKLGYPYSYFAASCSITLLGKKVFVSGQALFSKYPLDNCAGHRFDPTFPTDRMGFVVADLKLPDGRIISIASLHLVWLDWLRKDSRSREWKMVEKILAERQAGKIVAGDFNGNAADIASLRACEPKSDWLHTYPSWKPAKRIDWILASEDFQFESYKNIKEKLSDHMATMTTLVYS